MIGTLLGTINNLDNLKSLNLPSGIYLITKYENEIIITDKIFYNEN